MSVLTTALHHHGLVALADRCDTAVGDLDGHRTWLTSGDAGLTADTLRGRLAQGGRVVLALSHRDGASAVNLAEVAGMRLGEVTTGADALDPLVASLTVVIAGCGPTDGLGATASEVSVLLGAGEVVAEVAGRPVARVTVIDGTELVVIGTTTLFDDAHLPGHGAPALVSWLLTGAVVPSARELVTTLVPSSHPSHQLPPVLHVGDGWLDAAAVPEAPVGSVEFVRAAGRAGRHLPADLFDALVDAVDDGLDAGALLVKGLPLGDIGLTPETPSAPSTKDRVSEFVLLMVARRLGQPIGYAPEHGGDIVQNILPTRAAANRQVSTSSKVDLMFHTEAAFHRHRPRFLLLLCLRGDRDGRAMTTLSSIREVVDALPLGVRRTLSEPRFRTAADESYVGGRPTVLGNPMPVLSGSMEAPRMVFDADLMVGIDAEADAALGVLAEVLATNHTGVVLEAGDLLVVDNTVAVHGRSAFTPRFDGYDRWLQRSFVVADLAPSSGERDGRVVTTRFAR